MDAGSEPTYEEKKSTPWEANALVSLRICADSPEHRCSAI